MQVDRYIYNLSHRVFPVKTLLESGTEPVSGLLGFQAPTLTSRFIRGCVSPLRRCTLVSAANDPSVFKSWRRPLLGLSSG